MSLLRVCVVKPFLDPPGSQHKQFIFNLIRAEFWSGLSWTAVLFSAHLDKKVTFCNRAFQKVAHGTFVTDSLGEIV